MNFAETMATNPPRLVVLYRRREDGEDQFQWGVVGNIPILSLIGAVTAAEVNLINGEWLPEIEDQTAFVIAWDDVSKETSCFVNGGIPVEPLVGMLEMVKVMLVNGRLAQQQAAQRYELLGPDGTPMRR